MALVNEPNQSDAGEAEQEEAEVEIEATQALSFGSQLVSMMNDFLTSQRTILRLVNFVLTRQSEIDSRQDLAVELARREYPDVPAAIVEGVVKGLDEVAELAAELGDAPTREDFAKLESVLDAAMSVLPDEYQSPHFVSSVARAGTQEPSTPLFMSSLLTTLVGDYEVFIASLARAVVTRHPGSLDSSERTFTWRDISAHSTLEELKAQVIEKAVDDLLRESSEGWMKFFETKYRLAIPPLARTPELLEVFQRRHVIVHNGGRVSRLYMEHTSKIESPPNIGDRLSVDLEYFQKAADMLCIVALALVHNVARKLLPKDELAHTEDTITNVPYRLLQDRRYAVTKSIAEHQSLHPFENDYMRLVVQVNGWLAKKRLGEIAQCRAEIESWQTNTLQPIFVLAKHALLDNLEEGHALVLELRGSQSLPVQFWLTWPLLAELREYERGLAPDNAA
jgi:hypothetical protein